MTERPAEAAHVPTLEQISEAHPYSSFGVLARELIELRERVERLERNAPFSVFGR